MASNAQHRAVDGSSYTSKPGACRDRNNIGVLCLPEEVWQNIALNLSAEDVLSLLCVNRRLCVGLGQSACVWKLLSKRDGMFCHEPHEPPPTKQCSAQQQKQPSRFGHLDRYSDWRAIKHSYLFRCHKSDPSKRGGGVRWYPVRPYGQFAGISDREGHLSCVLSRQAISRYDSLAPQTVPHERIVVITGGFSNDDSIYLIHAGTGTTANNNSSSTDVARRHHHWDTKRVDPIGRGPSFAYGATLTALPTIYSESPSDGDRPRTLTATMRAIRFGGFQAGGYSNETSQVLLLTVKQDATLVQKRQRRRGKRERQHNESTESGDVESWSALEWQWNTPWEVEWSNITTTEITPSNTNEEYLSRAYHSSTLLLDRYLVVIGGMKTDGSVMNEAVLDTKTWTWIGNEAIACGIDNMDSRPSGRHGHSVVLDDSRDRLVLYGGGSGSDLLRSGEDNSEVWELQLGDGWRDSEKFAESYLWKWKKLHEDSNNRNNDDSDKNEETTGSTENSTRSRTPKLSPSETLCLGRCHHGIKISRDTVLFLFGSGRPSTNGLLAYDLKSDEFFRNKNSSQQLESKISANFSDSASTGGTFFIRGILPKPRFTGIAAFLEEDGYIITHGGYCSQDHDTIGTIDVLDLAPGVRGRLNNHTSTTFDGLAIDDRRVSYGEVTDSQAERGRQDPHAAMQRMLTTLMNKPASERQAAARIMLHEMENGFRPSNGQSLMLMAMIANGNPLFVGSEGEDGSDSE